MFQYFFRALPLRPVPSDGQLDLISEVERQHIRKVYRWSIAISMGLAVLGYLAYFLPVYHWPHLFPKTTIPYFGGGSFTFPLVAFLWGLFLGYLELWLLVFLNLYGVHEIALATGFISDAQSKKAQEKTLLDAGQEIPNRQAARYGIDPYQGINPVGLFFFNLLLRFKGFLGNQLIRVVAVRLLGRFGVRWLVDFSGMPLFMGLNAYATHNAYREARVVLLGNALLQRFFDRLPKGLFQGPEEKELLYDTLQFIAVSKRDYHHNHYLLTRTLLEFYQVPVKEKHLLAEDFAERLRNAPEETRKLLQTALCLGFVLDGRVSLREGRKIAALHASGAFPHDDTAMFQMGRHFYEGRSMHLALEALA